ncbi:MAG: DUF2279 domain-containing protein [Saprospiraceae bacterium]|nr:DUF2279 domain-containing protein [Saprospiraceae bacterium]
MQKYFLILVILLFSMEGRTQKLSFFEPSDTFHKKRFYTALSLSTATYSIFSVGLYNSWYKKHNTGSFHLFNDWNEWKHMDKFGHVYTAYFQSVLCYKGAKWTGLSNKKSMLTGMLCGGLFQTTIEIMDGFSDKWGFSFPDFGANMLGLGIFAAQQHWWNEQRIYLKVSSIPQQYNNNLITSQNGLYTTSLHARTKELYGDNYLESYLKDYNAQVYWMSINLKSFLPQGKKWPSWLNFAVGYGAENMFGGFENRWNYKDSYFLIPGNEYPRLHQFYIGLDLDLQKIRTKNKTLNTVFTMLNVFKVPSPALEINSEGRITFHFFR